MPGVRIDSGGNGLAISKSAEPGSYRVCAALSQFPLGWEMGEFRNTRDTPSRARGQIGSRYEETDINHLSQFFVSEAKCEKLGERSIG